jgi:hypothetical protein
MPKAAAECKKFAPRIAGVKAARKINYSLVTRARPAEDGEREEGRGRNSARNFPSKISQGTYELFPRRSSVRRDFPYLAAAAATAVVSFF